MKSKNITVIVSIALGLILILSAVTIIPSGYVGIKTNLGKISPNVLNPGVNLVIPLIETVNNMSVQQQQVPETFAVQTKDNQLITVTGTAVYNINPSNAANTAIRIGYDPDTISKVVFQPKLLSTTKRVISQYGMEDAISKQAEISTEIQAELIQSLSTDGSIVFDGFNITGFVLNPDVQRSIESKQIALQEKQRKQTELETAQLENQRLSKIGSALTPLLIEQQLIEKWDGKSLLIRGNNSVLIDSKSK